MDYNSRKLQEYFNDKDLVRELNECKLYNTQKQPLKQEASKKCIFEDICEKSNLRYEQPTFMDNAYDSNHKNRYSKEVISLRKKLRELRDKRIEENAKIQPNVKKIELNPKHIGENENFVRNKKSEYKLQLQFDLKKDLSDQYVASRKRLPVTFDKDITKITYQVPNPLTEIVPALAKVKSNILKKKSSNSMRKARSAGKCIKLETVPILDTLKPNITMAISQNNPVDEKDHGDVCPAWPARKRLLSDKLLGEISQKNNAKIKNARHGDQFNWPVRESLFPNIPPYIKFNSFDAEKPFKMPVGRKSLKWKIAKGTPILVRQTLTNTGFSFVTKSNEWIGTWGAHMKPYLFKTLSAAQKMNHFPGTFHIGRKDRLWRNLQTLILKYGRRKFRFIPRTYVLPLDMIRLKFYWESRAGDLKWIIKPPAAARGVGIRVINKWSQLPKQVPLIVQKYISDPYLINASKFDLRLYVLVTSFNPLRIYLYSDGLARFASAKYSAETEDLKNRYRHLTNYSINKFSSEYTANLDANACLGHKWTLLKLWEYLEEQDVDTKTLWKSLEELVIKTIISVEAPVTRICNESLNNRYNCYELVGVDVLLDRRLKPWLLEVNICPSLNSGSPLDIHVKGPLIHSILNIAQFQYPPYTKQFMNAPKCYEPKLFTMALTAKEKSKHDHFSEGDTREEYINKILENLTGDDVRHLTQAEDELTVIGNFQRIFPTSETHKYLCFMETRYYNRLFDAWETLYENHRPQGIAILKDLCAKKVHLQVASTRTVNPDQINLEDLI